MIISNYLNQKEHSFKLPSWEEAYTSINAIHPQRNLWCLDDGPDIELKNPLISSLSGNETYQRNRISNEFLNERDQRKFLGVERKVKGKEPHELKYNSSGNSSTTPLEKELIYTKEWIIYIVSSINSLQESFHKLSLSLEDGDWLSDEKIWKILKQGMSKSVTNIEKEEAIAKSINGESCLLLQATEALGSQFIRTATQLVDYVVAHEAVLKQRVQRGYEAADAAARGAIQRKAQDTANQLSNLQRSREELLTASTRTVSSLQLELDCVRQSCRDEITETQRTYQGIVRQLRGEIGTVQAQLSAYQTENDIFRTKMIGLEAELDQSEARVGKLQQQLTAQLADSKERHDKKLKEALELQEKQLEDRHQLLEVMLRQQNEQSLNEYKLLYEGKIEKLQASLGELQLGGKDRETYFKDTVSELQLHIDRLQHQLQHSQEELARQSESYESEMRTMRADHEQSFRAEREVAANQLSEAIRFVRETTREETRQAMLGAEERRRKEKLTFTTSTQTEPIYLRDSTNHTNSIPGVKDTSLRSPAAAVDRHFWKDPRTEAASQLGKTAVAMFPPQHFPSPTGQRGGQTDRVAVARDTQEFEAAIQLRNEFHQELALLTAESRTLKEKLHRSTAASTAGPPYSLLGGRELAGLQVAEGEGVSQRDLLAWETDRRNSV